MWEEKKMRQALKFKQLVEEGHFVPNEVIQKLVHKEQKTGHESEIIDKWENLSQDRKRKVDKLRTELKLAEADVNLKRFLNLDKPQIEKAQEVLQQILTLKISPLMLKKQPKIVKSIQKICFYTSKYVENRQKIVEIRNLAERIWTKFKESFKLNPDFDQFDTWFMQQLKEHQEKVENWPSEKVTFMTSE